MTDIWCYEPPTWCHDPCDYYEPPTCPPVREHERVRGDNGVGNGLDPHPPGDPPINDGPGTGPGNPGNRGGGGFRFA